jgi:hypothetical protein
LLGVASKAHKKNRLDCGLSVAELDAEMIESDLTNSNRNALVAKEGFHSSPKKVVKCIVGIINVGAIYGRAGQGCLILHVLGSAGS